MKPTKPIFFLAVLICLHISSRAAQPDLQPDEKTIAVLNKFRSDYTKSMLEKKPELLGNYYAENIRFMPEFQKTVMGKNNALTYQKAFSSRFDITAYSRSETEILDLGSRVVELGMFTMKMALKSTDQQDELQAKYLLIWNKQENGNLSLITEAWNYTSHPQFAENLVFNEVPNVNIAFQAHVPINNSISFELAALNRLLETTITQHDATIWSQFYADDGMLFYSNNPIYKGRKELDDFYREHVKHLPVFEKLDIRNDHIDDLGVYVIEFASHIAIIRDGDYSGISTGKNIRIWRREKNGSLKIFRGMGMYD